MEVRQLGDSVSHVLVDRTRDLAALGMGDRDIHIARGDCRGEGLETVSYSEHHIGQQCLEMSRKLNGSQTHRLRHGNWRLPLDDRMNDGIGLETVLAHDVNYRAEAVEKGRGTDNKLEL